MRRILKEALLKHDMLLLERSDETACQPSSVADIALLAESFASLGYKLDGTSLATLYTVGKKDLSVFYNESYMLLACAKGANVQHKVFYPNFPFMANVTANEYYIRAVLHYLTARKDDYGFANADIKEREHENVNNEEKITLTIVDIARADDVLVGDGIAALTQKLPVAESEIETYETIWRTYADRIVPTEIPFKENMARYVVALTDGKKPTITPNMLSFCKTITDVLRVYAVVSGESEQLYYPLQFVSLPRSARKTVLDKIDKLCTSSNADEDVQRNEFLWKRAFEKLHPGEYKHDFPHVYALASALRNGILPKTFEAQLDVLKCNPDGYMLALASRPTEFARRLDFMLRSFDTATVLRNFHSVAKNVSVNVLATLLEFYRNRCDMPKDVRDIVFYSESLRMVQVPETRAELPKEVCAAVCNVIVCALADRFADYPQKGTLYIGENMKNYAVPTSSRSASKQTHTLTHGSIVYVGDGERGDFVRLFTHWKNGDSRVDIDLSVELVSDDLKNAISLSWHNPDGGKPFNSYHSGDFTTAPDGASEFVDLDIAAARKFGRYAVVCNYCYTGQTFDVIPECFSGVMFMPQRAKRGAVFNPQFVRHKFDLTQHANKNIAFALDLQTLTMVWMDVNLLSAHSNLVASGDSGLVIALRRALRKHVTMDEWLRLHISHLALTDNRNAATIVADDDGNADLSPYDTEKFAAEWM